MFKGVGIFIMKSASFFLLLVGMLLCAMLLVGCTGVKNIADIKANPLDYENKPVTVKGTVGETLWFAVLSKGAYQLGDDSGTIWVVTGRPPPQQGSRVATEGVVSTAFKIGDTTLGTVITESRRH
jgi:hypothetical protein